MNCRASLAGPYCAACGQRVRDGRLSLGHVARQVVGEVVPVDHGFAYTALAVLRRPGRVARDYVDGLTVRYVGPAKYFMLLVGAAQLVALRIHFLDDMVAGFFAGFYRDTAAPTGAQARALAIVTRYFVSMSAAMVPLFAACTRWLFRRARLNYAEHLVLALYTGAQQVALLMLMAWFVAVVRVRWLDAAYVPLALAYQVWALRDFTGARTASAAWRTLVAAVLATVVGASLFGALLSLLGGRA